MNCRQVYANRLKQNKPVPILSTEELPSRQIMFTPLKKIIIIILINEKPFNAYFIWESHMFLYIYV